MNLQFEKANTQHIDIIFAWLAEPHMMEFWDNSQAHKEDILNFIHGRKQHYFYGTTRYWIGLINKEPYCFLLSDRFEAEQDLSDVHRKHLSKSGHTVGLDFGIGNKSYLGKSLAAPTLEAFVNFYHHEIDPLTDTFFIDPNKDNARAKHVYSKAGFVEVGEFDVHAGAFKESVSCLMVKLSKICLSF